MLSEPAKTFTARLRSAFTTRLYNADRESQVDVEDPNDSERDDHLIGPDVGDRKGDDPEQGGDLGKPLSKSSAYRERSLELLTRPGVRPSLGAACTRSPLADRIASTLAAAVLAA